MHPSCTLPIVQQVELLCSFLFSAHLLRNLQPTSIKTLAQTMTGRTWQEGERIYKQGDAASHFYLVLAGEVVMYELDASTAAPTGPQQQQQQQQTSAQQPAATRAGTAHHHTQLQSPRARSSPRHATTTAAATAAGSSSPAGAAAAAATTGPAVVEVRRVGPREAFGEDDITAGVMAVWRSPITITQQQQQHTNTTQTQQPKCALEHSVQADISLCNFCGTWEGGEYLLWFHLLFYWWQLLCSKQCCCGCGLLLLTCGMVLRSTAAPLVDPAAGCPHRSFALQAAGCRLLSRRQAATELPHSSQTSTD